MDNNSFEKEIRRMMADLHLEPSEKIWPEIENQIQKKDRPTPMILLISLLLFLSAAKGYLILNRNSPQVAEEIPTQETSQSISTENQEENSFSSNQKDSDFNKDTQDSSEKTSESLKNQATPHSEKPEENPSTAFNPSDPIEKNITLENLTQNTAVDEKTPTGIDWHPAKSIETSFIYPSFDPDITMNKITLPRNVQTSVIHRKWDFAIAVTGGSAWLFDSFMDPGNPSDPPSQNSPDPNPNPEPDPGSPTVFPPLHPEPMSSYAIQAMMKKRISPHTRISLGPGYRQWNIRQSTGQKIHSPDGDYYLSHPNGTHLHKSKIHFLELPVSLETQLNPGSSPFLFWHGGIHISRLLGTSVLQFDSERAHYIEAPSSFSPWQVGLNTGFDIQIFTRKNIPVKIGPYFYYSLSKISKEGLYGGKHLSSAGLKIEFLLSKK